MITDTVLSSDIAATGRLDSEFHLSKGIQARRFLLHATRRGVRTTNLGGPGGLAHVMRPNRAPRQVLSGAEENAVPYIRPYDVFDYLPAAADLLSSRANSRIDELRLTPGMVVLPRSGRNLGPAVAVDAYLATFALSDDAIRITPNDPQDLPYLLAWINSTFGQSLIRSNITGSVIDHIDPGHVASLPVPLIQGRAFDSVRALMAASLRTREQSRLTLANLKAELVNSLPPLPRSRFESGWVKSLSGLTERLDAAAYNPVAEHAADILRRAGGVALDSVAEIAKPVSRYKAYHVGPDYGRPFLAGGQIGQATVIAPKYMADRVFQHPDRYRLEAGEVIFPGDGRANEGLGLPVIVTPDRHGWLASEHVMRLKPRPGVHSGWLYLALTLPHVQQQIQALARGSVVDTLYRADVASVIVPQVSAVHGERASIAWDDFATAYSLEQRAIALLEAVLNESQDIQDVLITVREAAAVKSTHVGMIRSLIDRGALTSLGGADPEDTLLSLDEVLATALVSHDKEAEEEEHRGAVTPR